MLRSLSSYLLDLVFPPRCAGCLGFGHWFCDACAQEVLPASARLACLFCGQELPKTAQSAGFPCPACGESWGWMGAAALHEGPIRPAIHAFKYEGRVELAPSLARYLRAVTAETPWAAVFPQLDAMAPVPLHSDRFRERGFNQAELLTRSLASSANKPVLKEAILRTEATRSQVGLSPAERADNVAGKFWADSQTVAGLTLLLVDDVLTTGATMRECAAALRSQGASAVYGLALARPTMGPGAKDLTAL